MRYALAVLLAVAVVITSVLDISAHATSHHAQTSSSTHSHHVSSVLHLSGVCAVHQAAEVSTPDHQNHTGHHDGQGGADCDCICHSSARLDASADIIPEGFAGSLFAPTEAVLLKSIIMDVDDPPIIIALI